MKKVLLTGGTGFIGKNAIEPLLKRGYEIFAITSKGINPNDSHVNWIKCDLFNSGNIQETFNKIKPEYLLHFAWDTRPGIYLEDNSNFDFLNASLEMLKHFKKNGGKRTIFAGTCYEYELGAEVLYENSPRNPQTTYGKCKNHLNELASLYCEKNGISFGWGRIFYVFGQNENLKRLTGYVVNSLKNNEEVIINKSQLVKDYMYTKEIARAFVEFLDSNVKGDVNICTGQGISIGDFCRKVAQKMGKGNLLQLNEEPTTEPVFVVGSNNILKEKIGFINNYSIDTALDEIIETI